MNKEQIYDEKIAPLMKWIIATCKQHKIAMLASFHLPIEGDPTLECTTALLASEFEPPQQLLDALEIIRPPSSRPLMVTTKDADGKIIGMDVIL